MIRIRTDSNHREISWIRLRIQEEKQVEIKPVPEVKTELKEQK